MFSAYYAQNDMAMDFLETGLRNNGASYYMIWLRNAGLVAYWQQRGWPKMCTISGDDFSCR
jgi:hypothetical protein